MKNLWMAAICLCLTACAGSAQPVAFGGRYYMGGDSGCASATGGHALNAIMCYDKEGNFTGYRYPMSDAQTQAYANQRAQVQQLLTTMQTGNAQLQAQTQETLRRVQSNSMSVPTVGTNQSAVPAYCSNAGNVLTCRSPLPEANFSCIKAGNVYQCRQRN
jgi:hypothetical protein